MNAMQRTAVLMLVTLGLMSLAPGSGAQQSDDPNPVIVEITEIHLCCGACVKAVEKAAKIDGVQVEVIQDEGSAELTAGTYDDIQSALEAIAKAGFAGKIEDETQANKVHFPEIKTPDANVKKLTVRHIHNCCRGCSDAIIEAIESVDGVESNTVKPKVEEFTVEGNFDAGAVVEALQDAGFYPTL